MNTLKQIIRMGFLALCMVTSATADSLLMARVDKPFPEAMAILQSAISSRGYKVTRLQQVNENLERREFKSDMYRVVYFGKHEEVRQVTARHPELIPFLPLNITIFAEGEQSIVVTSHPRIMRQFFPDPSLRPVFDRWARDIVAMMDEVRGDHHPER